MSEWTPIKKLKPMKYKLTPKYKNGFSWVGDRFCKNNIPWLVANGFIEEDIPEEKWVNLYYCDSTKSLIESGSIYSSEIEAYGKLTACPLYIDTIKLKK